jgi:hypothetical protein
MTGRQEDISSMISFIKLMTGRQEDISSMISFIKLVETNPCLWNFGLKSSRTDLTSLAWRKIATEFKDTGKEVRCKI